MRRKRLVTLSLLMALLATPLLAQARPIAVGDMVRVTLRAQTDPTVGTLTVATATEWTLSLREGELKTLDPAQIVALELRTTRGHALQGTLIGAGAGLILGVAVTRNDCGTSGLGEEICTALTESFEGVVIVYTTVLGAGVGVLVGAILRTSSWVPGYMPAVQQGRGRVGLIWRLPAPW